MKPAFKKPVITFDNDRETKLAILDALGYAINAQDIIVHKDNPKQIAFSPDGLEIPIDKFAGVRPGSRMLIRGDIVSLMDLAEQNA